MTAWGDTLLDELPAMIAFARRRLTDRARLVGPASSSPLIAAVRADIQAQRRLLDWAEHWARARPDWPVSIRHAMEGDLGIVADAVRRLIQQHIDHPRFRRQWATSSTLDKTRRWRA